MSPKRPNLILSTDIPNIETCVLVRDGLDVEADSRNGVDFACGAGRELEGVKDSFKKRVLSAVGSNIFSASFAPRTAATRDMRLAMQHAPYSACREESRRTGLSGGIKTKHQQAHFLAAEDLGQGAGESGAHGCVCCVVVLWWLQLCFRWLSWSMLDALGADVLVLSLFLAGSRRAMVILLCDSRPVLGELSETFQWVLSQGNETFDAARGSPGDGGFRDSLRGEVRWIRLAGWLDGTREAGRGRA